MPVGLMLPHTKYTNNDASHRCEDRNNAGSLACRANVPYGKKAYVCATEPSGEELRQIFLSIRQALTREGL